jgi:hypothetical protein
MMILLKYKEEQEIVIREKTMFPVVGIAACGRGLPRQGYSSRVAVAAQPINKRILNRSERTAKRGTIKTRVLQAPFPGRHQPFSLLTLSSP